MKQLIGFLLAISFVTITNGQNVAINTDGSAANNSAMLDIKSTTKGMLVPRMTTQQRAAIISPATALLVYDTDTNSFWFFNGSAWTNLNAVSGGASGINWQLSGNNGTNPSTDFIGTSDNQSLTFKVNSQRSGMLYPNGSLSFGIDAGSNNTGYSNVAIGAKALYSNSDRNNLVAVGDSALYFNGLGANQPFEGRYNTAVGSKALFSNVTGFNNTSLGYEAMRSNTIGAYNTATGPNSLGLNTSGQKNTALGYASLYNNNADNNTAVGYYSLLNNTTGTGNSAVGFEALKMNTTTNYNSAFGHLSLRENTSGLYNTGIGAQSLTFNNSGHNNTAIGYSSLYLNASGFGNTSVGSSALSTNSTGIFNTATGYLSLKFNTAGTRNAAFGTMALNNNTDGSNNTAIGGLALTVNTTGSNNTAIGYNAGVTVNNLSNATAIGYNASVNASNKVVIGNSFVTSIGGFENWSNFSDGRFKQNVKQDVPGLSFINKLRPVTYTLDVDAINEFNSKDLPIEKKQVTLNSDKKNILYTGFMAQEVERAAQSLNYNFSGIDKPKDDSKQTYALRYSDFVVPLVKAVQEQQEMIEELKREIEELKKNR